MQTDILYGRKHRILVVSKKDGRTALDVSELRCTFRIEKVALQIANYAEINIYNLSAETERTIVSEGDRVIVEAGYDGYYTVDGSKGTKTFIANQYGVIFDGQVIQTLRSKEDAIDYVLTLVCLDGDSFLNNNIVSMTVNAGQNQRQIINNIASQALVPTEIGRVSSELSEQRLPRGKVIFGEPKTYLRNIARDNNGGFYIEDGKIYVNKATDSMDGQAIELSPQTGIIGVPEQTQDGGVSFRCLLNPKIKLMTMVKLNNTYIRQIKQEIGQYPVMLDQDGQYQTYKVSHQGDTRGNEWYTEVEGVGRYGKIPILLGDPSQTPY